MSNFINDRAINKILKAIRPKNYYIEADHGVKVLFLSYQDLIFKITFYDKVNPKNIEFYLSINNNTTRFNISKVCTYEEITRIRKLSIPEILKQLIEDSNEAVK